MIRRVVNAHQAPQVRPGRVENDQPVDYAARSAINRHRRSVRSRELIEAVQRLDVTADPAMTQAIMQWIADEYEARQGGRILGLFSRCYLGHPYIDHRLDLSGACILEHFTAAQNPPVPFQGARPLARSEAYAYIEVYEDGTVIPVREDGRPVV